MPRDGSNVYTQPFPNVVDGTTIESAVYNGFTTDVALDLNTPRPIVAGGTGADNADAALVNLGGEKAKQVVTNYDSHAFVPGSFYSAANATAAPNTHAFAGICYATNGTGDLRLEARDAVDDKLYLRVKTGAAWAASVAEDTISDARYVNLTGDTMSGALTVTPKGSQFGHRRWPRANTAVASTDADIKLYDIGGGNWSGIGSDPGGVMWFRTGTSGSLAPAMYIDATQFVHLSKTTPTNTDHVASKTYVDSTSNAAAALCVAQDRRHHERRPDG